MSKKNKSGKTESKDQQQVKEEQQPEVNQQQPAADAENETSGSQENPAEESALEQKLAEADAKVAELQDKYLRQMAEFDNYRKRTIREKADLIKTASEDIVKKVLPVIDDLERAIENNRKSEDVNAIREGFELIYNKFYHILEAEGLKKIPAKDQAFDTDFHEAIAMIPAADETAKGKVIDCTRDGYTLNDKVIRISQVVVAN